MKVRCHYWIPNLPTNVIAQLDVVVEATDMNNCKNIADVMARDLMGEIKIEPSGFDVIDWSD